MKQIILLTCIFAIALTPVFAVPSEDEVGQTLEGVMIIYASVMMGTMFGAVYEGAEATMDMETGLSVVEFKKMNVSRLFSADNPMIAMMTASGEELPEVVFSEISGTVSAEEEGDFLIDVSLKGGNVKSLLLTMKEEDVVSFKADGKDFKYLANDPGFMLMEE